MSEARKRAWETRRLKYGPRGHGSSYSRPGLDTYRMLDLILRLHREGTLSEGQVSRATGLHRIEIRKLADAPETRSQEREQGVTTE